VTICATLTWKAHVSNVLSKANSSLGFIRRNLKVSSRAIKERAYFTLVRPHLEYCCSVWDPNEKGLIDKLEMVQRRAARYVLGRYHKRASPTQMLEELGWASLRTRRRNMKLAMLYKINHSLIAIDGRDHNILPSTRPSSRHSNDQSFQIPHTNKDTYKHSFFPSTIRLWNALPNNTVGSPSLDSFKAGLLNN